MYLYSTHPYSGSIPGVNLKILPKFFTARNAITRDSRSQGQESTLTAKIATTVIQKAPQIWKLWQQLATLDVINQRMRLKTYLRKFPVDLVHAMRIQNEAYVAAGASKAPLIISIMGNDLVYTARDSRLQRFLTKRVLARCDALLSDCQRDLSLAEKFGLQKRARKQFFPGNGGVNLRFFQMGVEQSQRRPIIMYYRGVSPLFRPLTLLAAFKKLIPLVPEIQLHVLCPLASVKWFDQQRDLYSIPSKCLSVEAFVSPAELSRRLQQSMIVVSPAISDGTPNSMLEAMACGAFPVMSRLESIEEWIKHRRNGMLFDPEDPDDLFNSLLSAISEVELRSEAQKQNREIVENRADYDKVMPAVRLFYESILSR